MLQPQRAILCGMMHAVDEGLSNITAALRATKRLDSTLIVFSKAERRTGCFGCAELTGGHWAQAPTTAALARAQEQTSHCVAKKVSRPEAPSPYTLPASSDSTIPTATMWEGGVRGVGFVTGFGLSPAVRGTTSTALLHVSDVK